MKKSGTPSFVITLPLVTKGRDVAVMNKRFEAAKRLYNALLSEGLQRLKAMRCDPQWTELRGEKNQKEKRAGYKALREQYGFSEYALSAFGTSLKNRIWRDHLGAHEPQTLAKRAFFALDEYSFGKRGLPRFKGRLRPLHSIEGKSAASAIRYQTETGCVCWAGLLMPTLLPSQGKDPYLDQALQNRVKFTRIVWRMVNGKKRFFAQLVVEGQAPATCESVNAMGGLDIGPSTVAVFSECGAELLKFCPGVEPWAKELRRLQRKADRSLRATNPEAFDEKGRWVRGKKIRSSNRLLAIRTKISEAERKLQGRRKTEHGTLVNKLLSHANTWQIEKLSYRAFQKNFGKSVKNRAPGHFVEQLKRKAESAGGKVVELDTWKLKMSQYDHCTNSYTKKSLSLRWHRLGSGKGLIQRDVYSALLACCTDGKTHSPSRIEEILAAQECVLRRTGLWKNESASAAAYAAATA